MSDGMYRRTRRTDFLRGTSLANRFWSDAAGNVLPLTAAVTLILAGIVGSSVDMARGYKAERRLQSACDAGVLAGRRAVGSDGYNAAAEAQANTYFNANYDADAQQTPGAVFDSSSEDDGNTVVGTATADMPTIVMGVFGYDELDISVVCSASMGIGNSDIMFVLDNTGSMAWKPNGDTTSTESLTRMYALKQAMMNFYDTVDSTNSGSNARIRYGFVPYSTTVRVGQLLNDLDTSYISNSVTVQSYKLVNWSTNPVSTWTDPNFTYTSTTYNSWVHHTNTQYSSSSTCNNNKPADTAWVDTGASSVNSTSTSVEADSGNQVKTNGIHQPQTFIDYECRQTSSKWYVDKRTGTRTKRSTVYEERTPIHVTTNNATFTTAVLQSRQFDASSYKAFSAVTMPFDINTATPNRTKNISMTWNGCIQERQTVTNATFAFVDLLTGIDPSAAVDLDIDTAPTSEASRWKVQWPQVTFERDGQVGFEDLDDGLNGAVSTSEISENKASTPCPQTAAVFAEMDEDDFDDYVATMQPTGGTYHDIGMIWGARLSSPTGLWSDLVNEEPENGGSVSRHMIFMTDGELDTDRFANTAYGIERHDMRVTGTGTSDSTQLSRHRSRWRAMCEAIKARGIRLWIIAFGSGVTLSSDLTGCASADSAFKANDAAQLNTYFQEIANQVGELRVTQ